jgi:hypothetical protein
MIGMFRFIRASVILSAAKDLAAFREEPASSLRSE